MADIKIEDIKKLKDATGVGLTAAKKALEEAGGDYDKAVEEMRVKGLAKADKKSDRAAEAGLVHSYMHGERIGSMVEINCETDFVAKTDDFKDFVHEIALHVAAAAPQYVSVDDIPADVIAKEKDLFKQELENEGKKGDMVEKIIEGKVKKWQSEICLLEQGFIKDPDTKVGDLLREQIAKLGENMKIARFARFELGN